MPKVVAKKPAKIDFYKFVKPEKSRTTDAAQKGLVEALNNNIRATNNQGSTINSIANVLKDFVETQRRVFESMTSDVDTGFTAQFTKPQVDDEEEVIEVEELEGPKMPSFLEGIFNLFKDFMVLALAQPIMKWLSDPQNTEKIKKTVEVLGKFFMGVADFLGDRIVGLIDNLYGFFDPSKNWWEKLGNLLGGLADFAGLFIAIRWLTNPLKILDDLGAVFKLLIKTLTGSKKKLKNSLKRAGVAGLLVGGGLLAYQAMTKSDLENEASGGNNDEKGTTIEMAMGGWIQGPMSGYPVSLDGGKTTAFIGHGTEYVAQKAGGGFVVPVDTPATRKNPALMGQRMTEGQNLGFNMDNFFGGNLNPGFSEGGSVYAPVLDLIAKYEAGPHGWEAMYPSTRLEGATKMTISDVAKKATGAVGMYQNLPRYLVGRANAVGLDPNKDVYDKKNQTKIAEYLIGRGQAGVTPQMMKDNPAKAMERLSKVWAAIPVPRNMQGHVREVEMGESYYAGDGANKAHITPEMMYTAMKKVSGQPIKSEIKATIDPQQLQSEVSKDPVSAFQTMITGFDDAFKGNTESIKEKLSGLANTFSEAFNPSSFKEQLANITSDGSSGSMGSTKTVKEEKEKVDAAKTEKKQAQLTMIQQVQQIAQAANEKVKAVAAKHAEQTASAENAANSKKPAVIPSGGNTHTQDLIAQLNSGNNPLKVFTGSC